MSQHKFPSKFRGSFFGEGKACFCGRLFQKVVFGDTIGKGLQYEEPHAKGYAVIMGGYGMKSQSFNDIRRQA